MIRRFWHEWVLRHIVLRRNGYWYCVDCKGHWENRPTRAYRS